MAFVNRFGHAPPIAPSRGGRFRMPTIRMGEDAGCSRRSLRLLCGGWLPHDDGASEDCLALATDIGVAACPTQIRGVPSTAPGVLADADRGMWASGAERDALADRPDEPEQLAGDGGSGHHRALPAR